MKSLISITSVNIIVTRVTLQCPMYYMHVVMQLIVHQHLFIKPHDSTWPTCRCDIYRDNCIINVVVVVDLCCCCCMYIIQKGFKLRLPNLALWCGYDIGFKRSKVKITWSENQWAWVSWSFSSADCSTVAVQLQYFWCQHQGTESEVTSHQNNDHWHHLQLLASRLSRLPSERLDDAVSAAATSHLEVSLLLTASFQFIIFLWFFSS